MVQEEFKILVLVYDLMSMHNLNSDEIKKKRISFISVDYLMIRRSLSLIISIPLNYMDCNTAFVC